MPFLPPNQQRQSTEGNKTPPDEKLQAHVESAVPVEAASENRTQTAAELLGRQRSDAEDTVGVPSVPPHRDCSHDGLQHADGG